MHSTLSDFIQCELYPFNTAGNLKTWGKVGRSHGPEMADLNDYVDNADMPAINLAIDALSKVLDSTEVRHRVLSHNLANINTPGFQRLDVDFDEVVRSTLEGESTAAGEPVVVETNDPAARPDGNNVDIDRELASLTENAMTSQISAQLLSRMLSMLGRAVR